jgi:hypothetical protein
MVAPETVSAPAAADSAELIAIAASIAAAHARTERADLFIVTIGALCAAEGAIPEALPAHIGSANVRAISSFSRLQRAFVRQAFGGRLQDPVEVRALGSAGGAPAGFAGDLAARLAAAFHVQPDAVAVAMLSDGCSRLASLASRTQLCAIRRLRHSTTMPPTLTPLTIS